MSLFVVVKVVEVVLALAFALASALALMSSRVVTIISVAVPL